MEHYKEMFDAPLWPFRAVVTALKPAIKNDDWQQFEGDNPSPQQLESPPFSFTLNQQAAGQTPTRATVFDSPLDPTIGSAGLEIRVSI